MMFIHKIGDWTKLREEEVAKAGQNSAKVD